MNIITKDGYTLTGNLIENSNARATIILSIGTAAKTGFYRHFAEFIASYGYNVFLWNYRGFGESKKSSLKNSDIRFSDLGLYDIPAIIETIKQKFPDMPLYYIGHSAGGQQISLAHNHNKIDAMIAIAVSTGYFRYMPLSYRIKALFFFYIFSPISSKLKGYVAAKKFNLMEDLPPKLATQWGNWCSKPDYYYDDKFYGKDIPDIKANPLNFPIHVLTADDDEISSKNNVKNFWKHIVSNKPIIHKTYIAKDSPKHEIGHFGYFKKSNDYIWHDVIKILDGFDKQ